MRMKEWLLFRPDELGGGTGDGMGGTGGGASGGSSPAASVAASAPETPVSTPASAEPATLAGAMPATPGTTGTSTDPAYMSVRDALAGYGLDLRGQFQDDHSALQHLILLANRAQENNQLAQYGQEYLQNAEQFRAWQNQQAQAQQEQARKQKEWFKAPEFDPSWQHKLTRDPSTGELRVMPGNDPSILQKYHQWVEHQRNFMERFSRDPIEAIKPGLEGVVREMAEKIVQQQLGGFQEQTEAQRFVSQNRAWLHQQDQNGRVVTNEAGQPLLSPLGQTFARYVNRAEQIGLRNVKEQQDYALALTQRDYLAAVMQQQSAQQGVQQQGVQQPANPIDAANQAARNSFLAGAQQGRGSQAATAAVVPTSPAPTTTRGLADAMMAEMAANGFQPGQRLF